MHVAVGFINQVQHAHHVLRIVLPVVMEVLAVNVRMDIELIQMLVLNKLQHIVKFIQVASAVLVRIITFFMLQKKHV